MATTIHHLGMSGLSLLLSAAFGCASGDLVLPEPPGGGEHVVLSKVTGDTQEARVGEQLPFVVSVRTAGDLPATGREVAFVVSSGAVELSRNIAVTNSDGVAVSHCVLGTVPGDYLIQATLIDLEEPQVQEFTAKAIPGLPDTLSVRSDAAQAGRRGGVAAFPPVIRVADKFGNPVPEVPVAWQVTAGEGQTSEPISRTGADGTATVQWTLGNRIGVHKLTASIESATGSPALFTATVLF
jgi:hypothetical protein